MKLLATVLVVCSLSAPTFADVSPPNGYTNFDHDYWKLRLPDRWLAEDDEGTFIARSLTQRYAIYITLYGMQEIDDLETWLRDEIEGVKGTKYSMPGSEFIFANKEMRSHSSCPSILIDGVDSNNETRIYSQHIVAENILYTIAFHDYGYDIDEQSDVVLGNLKNGFLIKNFPCSLKP